MNVAIVEDDKLSALFLKKTLSDQGCQIVGCFDESAPVLDFAKGHTIDFVTMDVDIHGEFNGIELAIELRERFNIPSFFITSHTDSATITRAMQARPLGYATKPVSVAHVESIVASIKEILNKEALPHEECDSAITALGMGYSYNPDSKSLINDGHPVDLTPGETKLFDLCLHSKGYIVPYEVVHKTVWGNKKVSASTRRGLYHRLRSKLDNQLFETVSGLGCRIQLPAK